MIVKQEDSLKFQKKLKMIYFVHKGSKIRM